MRCEKLGGMWSEAACVQYQDAGRYECRGCKQGEEVREKNREASGVSARGVKTGEGNRNDAQGQETGTRGSLTRKKLCKKCGQEKSAGDFSPDKKSADGLRYYCKVCTAALSKEYQAKKREAGKPAGVPPQLDSLRKEAGKGKERKAPGVRAQGVKTRGGKSKGQSIESKDSDPLTRQVGGVHYKDYQIQPFEFFLRNKIPHHKAAVIRRILRYDHPTGGGLEDLEKIRHELDLIIRLEGWGKEQEA